MARGWELLYSLSWWDVTVRQNPRVLGAAWAIVRPLFITRILTIAFGKFARSSAQWIRYPVFVLAGVVLRTPWHVAPLANSTASAPVLFAFGLFYFRLIERWFADNV